MTDRPASYSIKKWPEGERPREKLIQFGAESLTDAELLAILLRVGNEGSSAIDIGRLLIDRLDGLCGIDRAHVEDILQFNGLGIAKTAQLKAAIEIGKRVRRLNAIPVSFDSAYAIAAFCYPQFEGKRHEQGFRLELIDMGTKEGGTFPIHQKMYEAIAASEIIICDLTGHRPNVYVEAGYALKHYEQNRLIFIFEPKDDEDRVPFDLSPYKYVQISQAAEIPGKLKPEIIAILRDAGAAIDEDNP